jgi:hydrogenase maturation protease
MSPVRIIGVGSRFGDDRAGLEMAARLAAAPPRGCEVVATERPGAELIELFAGAGAVILLDAVRSGSAAGTVHDLALEDLPQPFRSMSSHGIGITDALALAQVLGRRPRGRLIGVEAAPGNGAMDQPLSAAVAAALGRAMKRVHAWVDRYGGAERAGDAEGADR